MLNKNILLLYDFYNKNDIIFYETLTLDFISNLSEEINLTILTKSAFIFSNQKNIKIIYADKDIKIIKNILDKYNIKTILSLQYDEINIKLLNNNLDLICSYSKDCNKYLKYLNSLFINKKQKSNEFQIYSCAYVTDKDCNIYKIFSIKKTEKKFQFNFLNDINTVNLLNKNISLFVLKYKIKFAILNLEIKLFEDNNIEIESISSGITILFFEFLKYKNISFNDFFDNILNNTIINIDFQLQKFNFYNFNKSKEFIVFNEKDHRRVVYIEKYKDRNLSINKEESSGFFNTNYIDNIFTDYENNFYKDFYYNSKEINNKKFNLSLIKDKEKYMFFKHEDNNLILVNPFINQHLKEILIEIGNNKLNSNQKETLYFYVNKNNDIDYCDKESKLTLEYLILNQNHNKELERFYISIEKKENIFIHKEKTIERSYLSYLFLKIKKYKNKFGNLNISFQEEDRDYFNYYLNNLKNLQCEVNNINKPFFAKINYNNHDPSEIIQIKNHDHLEALLYAIKIYNNKKLLNKFLNQIITL